MSRYSIMVTAALLFASAPVLHAEIVIAEGESFTPADTKGWKVTHQNDTYGSHTYGGMWMTHGACLGAVADSVDAVAKKSVTIQEGGQFRVWSKYQAPPYFNYLHKIEVAQNGKTLFSRVFGKKKTDRLWSFSGESDELWWPWGVDHDCAESPDVLVPLVKGTAEIRLIAVANEKPAGDRFVDFIVLTTNPKNEYKGFKPYAVGSPFANEALDASRLYLRFRNTSGKPGQLEVTRAGHFQPQYGGASTKVPAAAVAPGQWSEWFNIGPFCRLVHDEGLTLNLAGAGDIPVQFARDAAGSDLVGDLSVKTGESVVVPLEITWQKTARVKASRQHAAEIIAESKNWRKANGGKRPQQILYYGAFSGTEDWVSDLKSTLGYNTMLPAKYEQVKVNRLHAHAHNPAEITAFAKGLTDKSSLRVLSFGDEISLGTINYADPKMQEKFRVWLKSKSITQADLGVAPDKATLTPKGDPRLVWYSNQFNEEDRFAAYREMTALAKQLLGDQVLTGANYSPHHGCLYYGPIYQWIDIFKHKGMTMFWAEDYLFSVPEPAQMISWMFAQMRCATKYHHQPIHMYVMPHAPGQEPGFLRRNMVLSVGYGARHIDNFWVALEERFTENYVGWNYRDTFRVLSESIFDSAEVEKYQAAGKVRPAKIAVVLSKATDFHETRLMVDRSQDPFAAMCKNAPKEINQTLCRKEQQMLYLALRHTQQPVDLITEEDILEGALKDLECVYFAGEWIDQRVVPKLEAWVKAGGTLYACAGLGHKNQFGEPDSALLKLLGLKDAKMTKNAYHMRTLLELPLCQMIDTITFDGETVDAVALKQVLNPAEAKVLGKWKDGSAAVTARELGKGKAYAVGTLAGTAYMKSATRPIPWARGGVHTLYNPTEFSPAAAKLAQLAALGIAARLPVRCSNPLVESILLDAKEGTVLTLVNWDNAPVKDLEVRMPMSQAPRSVRTVSGQRDIPTQFADGVLTFSLPLKEADYVLIRK